MSSKKNNLSNLVNALDKKTLEAFLMEIKPEVVSEINYNIRSLVYHWLGNPTKQRIDKIISSFPYLNRFINFDIIISRLKLIDTVENTVYGIDFNKIEANSDIRKYFGAHISDFFPELLEIIDLSAKRLEEIPQGINKADIWLYPYALDARADANLEAAIYFASRGRQDIVDVKVIKDSWYDSICVSIEKGYKIPVNVIERAKSRVISIAESSDVLKFNDSLPRFFSFLDQEEQFIDPTFFRTVEWFSITSFEPWLNSFAAEASINYTQDLDQIYSAWNLFFWCRSDLAISKIDKFGLESFLWTVINGTNERNKPWKRYYQVGEEYKLIDYIPLAGIILFTWYRIDPKNLDSSILNRTIELIFQTQMRSGAWPLHSSDSEGNLCSTCFIIHGLALAKPTGWLRASDLASKWLLGQQDSSGCWHIGGGPTVMLTVLVLDAINLSTNNQQVTFNYINDRTKKVTSLTKDEGMSMIEDPNYDFTNEAWYDIKLPKTSSVSRSTAGEEFKPKLALVVATLIELQQALQKLKPVKGQRKVWKVIDNNDTYYLGRFGKFDTIIMLTSMGSEGATGSTLSINELIRTWNPIAIILVGIAFGANKSKHLVGDVLISQCIIPYENQRVGEEIIFRGTMPSCSAALLNRFRNNLEWHFLRPDKTKIGKHIGPILSGGKLVDNLEFKEQLLKEFPEVIGGEMEGSGLWSSAARHKKEWIVVKSVCDWGDGKKHKQFQQLAAASAVSLCENVFNDPHALDGVV